MTEDSAPTSPSDKPVDDLIKELSYLHNILLLYAVEPEIVGQIFKQVCTALLLPFCPSDPDVRPS